MRLLPGNWQGFLDDVFLWGQLTIEARRTFLDGSRPGLTMEKAEENPAVEELRGAGLLSEAATPGYLSVDERYARFHALMKAFEGIRIFEAPGFDVLRDYLSEHMSQAERSHLHESVAFHPNDFGRIASLVTSVDWLESFLERHGGPPAAATADAQRILRYFMEQRDHVPLRDLEDYFPEIDRLALAAAIRLGVQSAVFFLSLRRTDLEPLIGIWPSTARRLRRAAIALAPEPAAVPERRFLFPFLIEDMTTLLLVSRLEPIPVRRIDERPFSRFEEEHAQALLSVPAWLEEFNGATPRIRVETAIAALRLGALVAAEKDDETLRFRPTPEGDSWVELAAGERLEAFLRLATRTLDRSGKRARSPAPGPQGGTGKADAAGADKRPAVLLSLLLGPWATWTEAGGDILPPLVQAFASVPRSSFVRFTDFARYQAAIANPLIPLRERGGGSALWTGLPSLPTDEVLEDMWQDFLRAYLSIGMLALGGAEVGLSAGGQACFRVTETGRFLLGVAPFLVNGEPEPKEGRDPARPEPAGEVVVQPTFEVAFLAPGPEAEAEIARFAERLGREVGILFRITKQSIARAASAGLGAERVIGSLVRFSKKPIPANVEHEIKGWISQASAERREHEDPER